MDQVPKTEKAQNEADTSNLDVFSGHSSPSPHQRPSHSGADHHQHGVSRHHGRTHHHEFQGFPDSAVSHDPTALAPTSSRGTVLSRPSHGEGFFDDKHPHGSRRHHGRPHHSAARRHSRSSQLGGLHHEGEPGFIRELFHDRKAYDHGGPRQDDACSSPSKQHLLQAHNHRRFLHHGETYSHHSSEGSCPHSITHSHHREHHHSARRHNYPHGDHRYGEHHHARAYGPHRSCSTARVGAADSHSATRPPAGPQLQSKAANLTHSRSASHARVFKGTKKVHPLDPASKSSEKLAKDEQLQKHKTSRIPRVHKKLHSVELFVWLWEKLSLLFHGFRKMLSDLTESLVFEAFIFFIVCLNTIMLVAQTFAEVEIRGEWYFVAFDSIFLCIYMVEAMLKIIAMGLSYFSDSWNNLDFFIMVMTVLDFMLMQFGSRSSKRTVYNQSVMRIFKVFKSLRALRATRVLRRLRFLTSLQEVTGTLVRSLPSITAILVLMFTCLLLFSVVLRALFHQSDPKRFQNIFTTIFTLFTLLTLDDWSLIYLDSRAQGAWYIVPILMIYIIIQYFIFLNLVIAVLVDNFQMALLKGLEKRAIQMDEKLLDQTLMELRKADPEEAVSEHTKQKRLIEKKFGTMTEKQRELLFHFLQLAAGVEHYQQKFRSQASVIDEIVDTTFETGEEDFRK